MIHRRDAMIRLGQLGGGFALPGLLRARASAPRGGTADSCIYLFLWGGPPQHDTFDLKPDAPAEIRGEFRPVHTNVPGIDICEQLPRLARLADRYALVRSLTHRSDNHEPSVYHMLTGRVPPRQFSVPNNQRARGDFPNVGSVVSHFTPAGGVPAAVTLPRPIGHSGTTYAGTYAGFLGPRHDPLERAPAKDTPETATHPLDPLPDLPEARIAARSGLLAQLQRQDAALQRAGGAGPDEYRDQALRMVANPAVRRAFDLDREPGRLRDWYGRNEYGESFLLARRLVEAGVGLVTISWMYIFPGGRVSNVWDNHSGLGIYGAKTGYDLLRSPVCLPPLDQGLSALIEDLDDRGLLPRTLIAAAGEFGRTPKVNKDAGRDHWGACQSALFAGGGVRGGQVIGRSDRHGAYPTDRPVAPADFLATIYGALGIDPHAELRDREHRPYQLVDGEPIAGLMG
ncbi:MAG TPA: DUF1501 domain-containing protein [Urbifossiella sp.]|jgi:hypothetical protein|nr:DUF1501 domain-containing protein [Urbifossiella sp.]